MCGRVVRVSLAMERMIRIQFGEEEYAGFTVDEVPVGILGAVCTGGRMDAYFMA